MTLGEQLIRDRKKIQRQWFQDVLEGFPKQSRYLIAGDEDRFTNPIGFTLNEGIEEVYAAVSGEKTVEEIDEGLSRLIKFKAVQKKDEQTGDLDFLVSLKRIIRKACGVEKAGFNDYQALMDIEDRIDRIILKAHNIFVASREKILELQVNEMKNKTYSLRRLSGEL